MPFFTPRAFLHLSESGARRLLALLLASSREGGDSRREGGNLAVVTISSRHSGTLPGSCWDLGNQGGATGAGGGRDFREMGGAGLVGRGGS